jgi:hypothetical protein
MEKLFIWFYTSDKSPKGIPSIDDCFLVEHFSPKKEIEGMDYEWMKYDPEEDGFPPRVAKHKFPKNLFFIVQKHKELIFDYYRFDENILIISESFLLYLNKHKLSKHMEVSNLKVFNKNGSVVKTKEEYHAIRIGKGDDHLFDFSGKTIRSGKDKDMFLLYPDLNINQNSDGRSIFFLNEFCYKGYPIFLEKVRDEIVKQFYIPEIYSIKEYPSVYKKQFSW